MSWSSEEMLLLRCFIFTEFSLKILFGVFQRRTSSSHSSNFLLPAEHQWEAKCKVEPVLSCPQWQQGLSWLHPTWEIQTALLSSVNVLGPAQLDPKARSLFTVCVWGGLEKNQRRAKEVYFFNFCLFANFGFGIGLGFLYYCSGKKEALPDLFKSCIWSDTTREVYYPSKPLYLPEWCHF